ncbi:hypothetical protein EVAR_95248_1 [Eumeta japonica]|uniref:Uncharacterized protein n=1 Tax=Eumeta variegata TaxID=151549 RepID=A0A4C1UKY1_EUMVA|nr:hypothetical protein EVAR_95248_1 [Eumeta japonica]
MINNFSVEPQIYKCSSHTLQFTNIFDIAALNGLPLKDRRPGQGRGPPLVTGSPESYVLEIQKGGLYPVLDVQLLKRSNKEICVGCQINPEVTLYFCARVKTLQYIKPCFEFWGENSLI